MAKGVKPTSPLWKAARDNRRYDKHVYKKFVTDFKKRKGGTDILITGDVPVTINNLYRAFHSPKTKPEYRTLMLHSLFEPSHWLTQQYNQFRTDKNKVVKVGLRIRNTKGELYLAMGIDQGGAARLTPKMMENIRVRKVRTTADKGYIQALTTSGHKQQKVAAWRWEMTSALVNMIQYITGILRITDPFNRFGSPPEDDEVNQDLLEKPMEDGTKDHILRNYEEALRDVKNQFTSGAPIYRALGLDTSDLELKWDELITKISDYNVLEMERPDLLAEAHSTAEEFAKIGFSYVEYLTNLSMDDPVVNKVAANLTVPKFRTPSVRKHFIKTMSSDDIPAALKEWVSRNSKGIINLDD